MEAQSILDTLKEKYIGLILDIYKDYSGELTLKETFESEKRISVIVIDVVKNNQGFFLVFNPDKRTYLQLYNL